MSPKSLSSHRIFQSILSCPVQMLFINCSNIFKMCRKLSIYKMHIQVNKTICKYYIWCTGMIISGLSTKISNRQIWDLDQL